MPRLSGPCRCSLVRAFSSSSRPPPFNYSRHYPPPDHGKWPWPARAQLPSSVRIVDVGPRDGLQNERRVLDTAVKVELCERLAGSGVPVIEAASFVSPKWVPQMADSAQVVAGLSQQSRARARFAALTPNLTGYDAAVSARVDEVAVFAAASEAFSLANINCSVAASLERFAPLMARARADNMPVRAYVSCVIGCPYDGWTPPSKVAELTARLLAMGAYEVSLGDTIGVGTPGLFARLLHVLTHEHGIGADKLALHCHDTYGQALANIAAALPFGIRVIDASVAGLGGCPYAVGATGNVATEDVVYMLHGSGIDTGIDLAKLVDAARWINQQMEREPASRLARVWK